jgi:hypothetical protein
MKKVFAIMSLVVFFSFAMNAQTTSTDTKEKTEKVTEAEKADKPAGSCCQKGGATTGEAKACCKKGDGTASTCSKSEGQGACCQKGGAQASKASKKKMKKAAANTEQKK